MCFQCLYNNNIVSVFIGYIYIGVRFVCVSCVFVNLLSDNTMM